MSAYITLPDSPFTYADVEALGISRHTLRRLVSENVVRRLVRGVYARADLADTVELRARAVAAVIPAHHVVRDRTAAWLHGTDTFTHAEHDIPPPI